MPLNYDRLIPNSLMRFTDDFRLKLDDPVESWVENECEGTSVLRFDGDHFILSFSDDIDATMFTIRFSGAPA